METMLWAALTWSVCEETNVHSQMYRLLCIALGKEKAMEWADEEDFRFCLNRLVRRGLVARCEGETKEEALFFLFQRAVLKPICYSFSDRMRSFTDSLVMGKGIKFALRAFQKPTFSYEEHKVFTQIMKNGTISDHLCSLQEEDTKVPVAEKQKRRFYRTGQPGVFTHFSFPVYKKKQLVISCIREEGGLEAKRGWQRLYENTEKNPDWV
ncbi:MAG: hypothetical protein ACLUTU_09735 [Blautia faecis]